VDTPQPRLTEGIQHACPARTAVHCEPETTIQRLKRVNGAVGHNMVVDRVQLWIMISDARPGLPSPKPNSGGAAARSNGKHVVARSGTLAHAAWA